METPDRVAANGWDGQAEMAAFIGHKGLGDEFHEWVFVRRAEINRLLEDEMTLIKRITFAMRGLLYGWRGYDVTTAQFPPNAR